MKMMKMTNTMQPLRRGVCGAAAAAVLLGPWGHGGLADAAPFAAKATGNATVQPSGPRTGNNGLVNFNVEGSSYNNNASFGVLEYTGSAFNFGGTVTAINGPLTLTLVESNAAFTRPGGLNFYLTQDTTTPILAGDPNAPKFQAASPPDGFGSQFADRTLIGTATFTSGASAPSQTDTYTLNLSAADQSFLLGQLNGGGKFKLLVGAADTTVAATYAGYSNTNPTFAATTTLSFDATVAVPQLAWAGGSGTWTNGGSSWRNAGTPVAWSPANQAVFAAAPAGTVTLTAPITVNRGLKFDVGGYTVAGTAANPLTLDGGTGAANVQVTNAADVATLSAVVAGTAGLNKTGPGTLTLSGANTFTGGVTVSAGTLAVAADAALGDAANGVVLAGGTLRAGGSFTVAAGRGALSGGGIVAAVPGATLRFENPVSAGALGVGDATNTGTVELAPAGTATLGSADVRAGATLSVPGLVAGTGNNVTLGGDGTVRLGGDNASSFPSGRFQLSKGSGTVGPTVVLARGTGLGGLSTNLNAGSIQGSVPLTGANAIFTQVSLGGDAGFGGTQPIELFSGLTFFGSAVKTLTVTNETTIVGQAKDGGSANNSMLVKAGTGTLILASGQNDYTGGTRVNGGTLTVAAGSVLGAANGTTGAVGPLEVNNPNAGPGTAVVLNLNNPAQTVGSLSGTVAAASSGTNTAVVNLGDGHTLTVVQSADGTFAGSIAGATGSLVKSGDAKLTLTGTSTYAGSTTVTAGTLDASGGSIAASVGPMSVTGTGSQLVAKRVAPSSLAVGAGAKVTLANVDTVAGSTPGATGRSAVGSLDDQGLLDVGRTGVVIASAVEATVRDQIVSGRGGAGGTATWAGTLGITSAAAAAAPGNRAIGYRVAGGQATVAFTVVGDADLSGSVGIDDLSALAQNYNQSGRGWAQGDFNYDGVVGIDDLSALAQNYNTNLGAGTGGGSGSAAALAAFAKDYAEVFGGEVPAGVVPEPAAAGLSAVAGLGLLARRRRRA